MVRAFFLMLTLLLFISLSELKPPDALKNTDSTLKWAEMLSLDALWLAWYSIVKLTKPPILKPARAIRWWSGQPAAGVLMQSDRRRLLAAEALGSALSLYSRTLGWIFAIH